MRATSETRVIHANQGEASFLEVFSCLLQDEMDFRHSRLIWGTGGTGDVHEITTCLCNISIACRPVFYAKLE
jgi:hypothetical protein